LKADQRTANIPVVALTGHALAGISERAKEAGCDAFVTKPCLPEDLVREIKRVLGAPAASVSRTPTPELAFPRERPPSTDRLLVRDYRNGNS
jgi:FixJ family two-component response regulator